MVRTQLYFDDSVHSRLRTMAARQGRTVSDLVREAVARAYGGADIDERLATLEGITAIWRNRSDLGATAAYVRRQRKDTRRNRAKG